MKNVRTAIEAFSYVRKVHGTATYHLYGIDYQVGGPAYQWAISKGFANGIEFHGPVSHEALAGALNGATLMVHPSHWESCPMGIAEAMAMGLPVIGGIKSGGVGEMIQNGGALTDVRSAEEIANAVNKLLENEEIYCNASAQALLRVSRLAPDRVTDQYVGEYERVKASAICGD